MVLLRRLVALAALLSAFGTPAAAMVVQYTYSGLVTTGADVTGLFGSAGAGLDGQGYSLSFTYDTARGSRIAGPGFDQIGGGAWSGSASPMLSAVLTIGGRSLSFGTGDRALLTALDGGIWFPGPSIELEAYQSSAGPLPGSHLDSTIFDTVVDTGASGLPSLDAPGPMRNSLGRGNGFFSYLLTSGNGEVIGHAWGYLHATGATAGTPVPVPAPPAAALLAGAVAGLALIRRRRPRLPFPAP